MHATATKENTNAHSRSQPSKPFFSKGEDGGFLSANKETKPFFSPAIIQPKLTINEPGDPYEQEANAMADRVMRMSEPAVQRKCAVCAEEEKEKVQRQAIEEEEAMQAKPLMRKASGGGYTASPQFASQLSSSEGGGSPLPDQTLGFMNQAFGTDFSKVRVHTGAQAAEMSQGIQAKAFTHGSDIYFNRGQYSPESSEGKRLLGHELTHVVQQGNVDFGGVPERKLSKGSQYKLNKRANSNLANVLQRRILVRSLEQDDEISREARRRIDETRSLLNDPILTTEARSELEARIREATVALQIYRRALGSGLIKGNPIVATTTMGDQTGITAGIAILLVLGAALITNQSLTRSSASRDLGRALQRLGETIRRSHPIPYSRGEPETQIETRTESRQRRQPSRQPQETVDVFPPIDIEDDRQRGCRAMEVGQRGGNTCHDEFAYLVSGKRREWGVETPEGLYVEFDAYGQDGVLYEIKTGYTFLLNTSPSTYRMREERINQFIEQSEDQLAVANRCGYQLVWMFNNEQVAEFVDGFIQPVVRWRPFPCDIDR